MVFILVLIFVIEILQFLTLETREFPLKNTHHRPNSSKHCDITTSWVCSHRAM